MTRRTGYHSDRWTIDDHLNFTDFGPALGEILQSAETPLAVGVFGPWGSGKTSLLRMLRHDIEKQKLPNLRSIWFNAWKYDQHDALWRALILRVIEALYPRKSGEGERETWERLPYDELTGEQKKQVTQLDRLAESLYQPVDWQELGRLTLNWWQMLREGGKAGAEIASVFIPGATLIKQAFEVLGGDKKADAELKNAAAAIRREVHSYQQVQLASMEQFEAGFEKALADILSESGRLIVFIDDLDRCLPEKAVEVLEAIKLFLEAPRVVFVLGMDREVIERGVESYYGAMFQNSRVERPELPIQGDVYLQKIIQIPFHIPPMGIEDVARYITESESGIGDDEPLSPLTRTVFAQGVYPNPRQVKRALNMFRMLRSIARQRIQRKALDADKVAWPLLAKTVLVQTQYPELYSRWRQYPTLMRTLEDLYAQQPLSEEERMFAGRRDEEKPERQDTPIQIAARSEVLGEYLRDRHRNILLERMLTFPPADQNGVGPERALFAGLSREEMEVYVRLAGTVTVDPEPAPALEMPTDLRAQMLSGDWLLMEDALAQLAERESDVQGSLHRSLAPELLKMMQSAERPAQERLNAGMALDRLGVDPPGLDDWVPALDQPTPWGFHIARYPVTNKQYRRFVDAGGYTEKKWWSEKGWENRQKNGWREPRLWDDERFNHSTQPVVGVSWYEANAYCQWLTEELRKAKFGLRNENPSSQSAIPNPPFEAQLPTQAQWMQAAGKATYPWGDAFDPAFANTEESNLGQTTPVHMHPQGQTAEGVWDMSGNVWEWTADVDTDGMPWLKGGAWYWSSDRAAAAARFDWSPRHWDGRFGFRCVVVPRSS